VRIQEALEIYRIFVKAVPQYEHLDMDEDDTWIFEGAQGVLLDEFHGFHPHTTWSKTTPANALSILHESGLKGYKGEVTKIGVMRSYMTRHGAGPFPTEDPSLHERFPEAHNDSEGLQGAWRVGWTDLRAMRYALDATGSMDQLAVTHLDRVGGDWKICTRYDKPLGVPWSTDREKWLQDRAWALEQISTATPQYAELPIMSPDALTEVIENELGVPVGITSYGPSYCDVKERVLA
jgi:adenylosuccinate synthase